MSVAVRIDTSGVAPVARIGGRAYKTARGAARAWAEAVMQGIDRRHSQKIGQAAYHDQNWYQWHYGQSATRTITGFGIAMEMIDGLPYTVSKAARRALPVFKQYLR